MNIKVEVTEAEIKELIKDSVLKKVGTPLGVSIGEVSFVYDEEEDQEAWITGAIVDVELPTEPVTL